jgi:hypothetical protein
MGERKVLNKYIPADFDPSLIPRGKKLSSKDGTVPVRMMLPFTAQCGTCHTFLYRGTKFNSRKEAMGGPDGTYLGITRWRFYIKCTSCARPLSFLTDPKNADYEMESGGTRNYEVHKDRTETEEAAVQEQEEEEKLDPMKALENRVLDSKREMQELASLEAIKAMNARHVHLLLSGDEGGLAAAKRSPGEDGDETGNANLPLEGKDDAPLSAEDEALIKSIRFGKATNPSAPPQPGSTAALRRLDERDEELLEQERARKLQQLELLGGRGGGGATQGSSSSEASAITAKLPVILVKKRKRVVLPEAPSGPSSSRPGPGPRPPPASPSATSSEPKAGGAEEPTAPAGTTKSAAGATPAENGLSSLLGGYGSDDDSDA